MDATQTIICPAVLDCSKLDPTFQDKPPDFTELWLESTPPPPYIVAVSSVIKQLKCTACHQLIYVAGEDNERFITCEYCKRLTPSTQAPVGQKYIRCNCDNIFMIDKTKMETLCSKCGIRLNLKPLTPPPERLSLCVRYKCGHCDDVFAVDPHLHVQIHFCTKCRKISALDVRYITKRIITALILALCFIIFTVILVARSELVLCAPNLVIILSLMIYVYKMKNTKICEKILTSET